MMKREDICVQINNSQQKLQYVRIGHLSNPVSCAASSHISRPCIEWELKTLSVQSSLLANMANWGQKQSPRQAMPPLRQGIQYGGDLHQLLPGSDSGEDKDTAGLR